MRRFRDQLIATSEGKAAVRDYERIAPLIVQSVSSRPDASAIWNAVYGDIRRAVDLVQTGKPEEAFKGYKQMVSGLAGKYLD